MKKCFSVKSCVRLINTLSAGLPLHCLPMYQSYPENHLCCHRNCHHWDNQSDRKNHPLYRQTMSDHCFHHQKIHLLYLYYHSPALYHPENPSCGRIKIVRRVIVRSIIITVVIIRIIVTFLSIMVNPSSSA